jgi:hypothetical protein
VAKRLRELGVKGILITAAERGYITEVRCGMPTSLLSPVCPSRPCKTTSARKPISYFGFETVEMNCPIPSNMELISSINSFWSWVSWASSNNESRGPRL